jgi:hypothetical protein
VDTTARCSAPRDGQGVVRAGNACVEDIGHCSLVAPSRQGQRHRLGCRDPCLHAQSSDHGGGRGGERVSGRVVEATAVLLAVLLVGGTGGMADGVRVVGCAAGARVGPRLPHPLSDGDAARTRRVRLRAGANGYERRFAAILLPDDIAVPSTDTELPRPRYCNETGLCYRRGDRMENVTQRFIIGQSTEECVDHLWFDVRCTVPYQQMPREEYDGRG